MATSSSVYHSSGQRAANVSNSPNTRNRVERKRNKRPNFASTLTPDRKRSSATKIRNGDVVKPSLADLPILPLTRVFFYLPMEDRRSLSQTCRKLRQAEQYANRGRCVLNVRNDLVYFYKEHLHDGSKDVFASTELFHKVLRRSFEGRSGSLCSIEKIARIDFGPPLRHDDSDADRKQWGGRMFVTETSLRSCFDGVSTTSVIELRLHHCHVSMGALNVLAEKFIGLEKLSLSLKGFEFPSADLNTSKLDERLAESVCNWSSLVKKKNQILTADVKEMVLTLYSKFPLLEVFLLYNE